MSSGYFEFGVNKPLETKYTDPVDLCLANNFFQLKDNPLVQGDATLCNNFMVQRCAKGWDDKCKLFLDQNIDPTFLLEVAKYKYCTLDPNSNCWEVCKPMNPLAQYSPTVCKVYGNQFYVKDSELYDLAGNFSLTSKLRNTSPVTFTKCPVQCQGVEKIEAKDAVMEVCLASGACQDVLQNLAIYASEKNIPVDNEGFKNFMDTYIMKKSSTNKTSVPSSFAMGNGSSYKNLADEVVQPAVTTTDIRPVNITSFSDPTISSQSNGQSESGKSTMMTWSLVILLLALIGYYVWFTTKK